MSDTMNRKTRVVIRASSPCPKCNGYGLTNRGELWVCSTCEAPIRRPLTYAEVIAIPPRFRPLPPPPARQATWSGVEVLGIAAAAALMGFALGLVAANADAGELFVGASQKVQECLQ